MGISGYMEKGVHHFPVRVYFSDTDAGGVVYHSRYIDMAEHARTELLRLTGEDQMERLLEERNGFVVQSLNITYKTPARLDDLLIIKTRILKKAVFSMVLEQNVTRNDQLIASLQVRVGHIALDGMKPVPIPEIWRTLE